MNKIKRCIICNSEIPNTRKMTAKCCSKEHSYELKKMGVRNKYYEKKKPLEEIKRNEAILSSLYWFEKELKRDLTITDLENSNLNFGLSTEQRAGNNGELWTVIGSYGYYIHPKTKILTLWKKP
jgi:hypothetical protein